MKRPASLAAKLGSVKGQKKIAKAVEIRSLLDGPQCTAAYIAELAGELAALASGARIANLAELLARAQLEAELWSRRSE